MKSAHKDSTRRTTSAPWESRIATPITKTANVSNAHMTTHLSSPNAEKTVSLDVSMKPMLILVRNVTHRSLSTGNIVTLTIAESSTTTDAFHVNAGSILQPTETVNLSRQDA